jgi:hypothetical protein
MGRDHHVAGLARRAALVLPLAAVAAGCLGSSSHHAALTASQAVAQAKADGFTKVMLAPGPPAWNCSHEIATTRANIESGVYKMYGRHLRFEKPRYQLEAKLPKVGGNGLVVIIALPSASLAARCVKAEFDIYERTIPGVIRQPYKVIDAATIVVDPNPPGAPGSTSPTATGDYEIYLSNGGVLALGNADTRQSAATVESKLSALVRQISGS